MSPAMSRTLRQPHLRPVLAIALIVPLAAGGAIAQASSAPTNAPAAVVSKNDREIIDTLQLAYRRGCRLMAMATSEEARTNQVYPLINWTDISVGIEEFQEKAGLWPGGDAATK
jgi:hypothetical protein